MVARSWRLLAFSAAVTALIAVLADASGESRIQTAMSRGTFVPSPPTMPHSTSRERNARDFRPLFRPDPSETSSPSTPSRSSSMRLAMSTSPNQSLQQQIIQGATLKLRTKDATKSLGPGEGQTKRPARETTNVPAGQFSYYIREGQPSEIKEIADVLMDSFRHNSQPSFDSYIRRYKYNHLRMFFEIDRRDRGLFVACAVPVSPSAAEDGEEEIVGFCSVDGRAPDPSCKLEFLTPSTLARTDPRPYLSDLGVRVSHQRRGIGEKLVRACEEWTTDRGYEKLYLKVEKKNAAGVGLYSSLGYRKTKLPWGKNAGVDGRWDTAVLMEKSLNDATIRKRKRTWIKNRVLRPLKTGIDRCSKRVNNAPPL